MYDGVICDIFCTPILKQVLGRKSVSARCSSGGEEEFTEKKVVGAMVRKVKVQAATFQGSGRWSVLRELAKESSKVLRWLELLEPKTRSCDTTVGGL